MSIFVCVKQVPDTETKIKISADKTGIDTSSVKWVMNPYDEFAVEEALLKKESIGSDKVIAISMGPARVVEALRTALAMGADEAIHIQTDTDCDSIYTAKAISAAIQKFGPAESIFTGKLSIDGNNSSIGPQIATLLGLAHTAVVSKFEVKGDHVVVEREIEAGSKEIVEMPKASVITANKGLNTPRFVSLPGIMKAKKKTVHTITPSDLGLSEATQDVIYKNFELPPEKPQVKMLSSDSAVKDLVKLLREESKVI
jgi:electron transfer flavoprotein beta subunit